LFRKEALRLHPDTSNQDGRVFQILRAHYEDALMHLVGSLKNDSLDSQGPDPAAAEKMDRLLLRREFHQAWRRFLYRNHFGSLGKLRITPHYEQTIRALREAMIRYAPDILEDFQSADRTIALLKQGLPHEKRARELWDKAFRSLGTYTSEGQDRNLRIAESCSEDAHSYLLLSQPQRSGIHAILQFYAFLREDILLYGPRGAVRN
jgi:hypothetical protein